MTRIACPSTEDAKVWWDNMQQNKQATKLIPVKDHGIYRLRAYTADRRKVGEMSLGLRNVRFAQRIVNSLSVTLDGDSPDAVVNRYIEMKLKHAETCRRGKYAEQILAISTEQSTNTIQSRLTAHFLPFCRSRKIRDLRDVFHGEFIASYMDHLYETVAISDTARSIMATTLTMLRWYNKKHDCTLIDGKFEEALESWRSFFGFKRSRPKIFLTTDQIQSVLTHRYTDDRTKALFLFPLVCGLRYQEFVNLRWRDLHFKQGNMDVLCAKGGTSRKAQLPKLMQDFLQNVRSTRKNGILDGDFIFAGYDRYHDLIRYKDILKDIANVDGNDVASNCLRRSGCDLIDSYQHGLGDKQLGHSICSRVTQRSYINNDNYSDVNYFWDSFYAVCQMPDTIVSVEMVRQMAMSPNNIVNLFSVDKVAV